MKKYFFVFGIIFFCLLSGCGSGNAPAVKELFAMDTYMKLTAYGNAPEAALQKAADKITELEDLFSVSDPQSDISRINSSVGFADKVDAQTAELISLAKLYSEKTDGAVDITIYPIVREWGFTTGNYSVPSPKTLEELLKYTGSENISVSECTVMIPEKFQLDLGSAAKGYAGDAAAEILKNEGISSAILDLGGNIRAVGEKPDGSPWRVAVTDPNSPEDIICTVSIKDRSVVTSGNYQRYFTDEMGKKYCHIIDPKTGFPVDNGVASVTVIGDSGAECDLLSTALFVMGKESAVSFIKENKEYEMLLITENGEIYISRKLFENAEFSDKIIGSKAEVIE